MTPEPTIGTKQTGLVPKGMANRFRGQRGHTPTPLADGVPRTRRTEWQVFVHFLRWMLPLWDKGLLVVLISIASATVSLIPP